MYIHQGWLTEDHDMFIFNDEEDEEEDHFNTRTYVMDVKDLRNPRYVGHHDGRTEAIDHNLYVKDNYVHQANYRAGYNLLEIDDVENTKFTEKGFFDIYPSSNGAKFNGAWSTYPYFPSGNVIVSGIEGGLFVLKPNISDDVCDGLRKKSCRKLEKDGIKIYKYSSTQKVAGDCEPKDNFADSCAFSDENQCNNGSNACEWTDGTCKHVCTDLSVRL